MLCNMLRGNNNRSTEINPGPIIPEVQATTVIFRPPAGFWHQTSYVVNHQKVQVNKEERGTAQMHNALLAMQPMLHR